MAAHCDCLENSEIGSMNPTIYQSSDTHPEKAVFIQDLNYARNFTRIYILGLKQDQTTKYPKYMA